MNKLSIMKFTVEATKGLRNTTSIIFLIFLILKLSNVIDWSWWWITSPYWIGLIITLLIGVYIKVKISNGF